MIYKKKIIDYNQRECFKAKRKLERAKKEYEEETT